MKQPVIKAEVYFPAYRPDQPPRSVRQVYVRLTPTQAVFVSIADPEYVPKSNEPILGSKTYRWARKSGVRIGYRGGMMRSWCIRGLPPMEEKSV